MVGGVGATGATGVVGGVGATGATGVVGGVGATGATGIAGGLGATGIAGGLGATGATGVVGATGIAGGLGATGATGVAGGVGATGIAGGLGATGATGVAGGVGATGIAGGLGATGATGVAGGVGGVGATGATGAISTSQLTQPYQHFSLSCGGTLTVKVVRNQAKIRWDAGVIATPLMGKATSTLYDIICPTSGTIGSGQTADTDGIPLGANSDNLATLYYVLPTASANTQFLNNFRIITSANTTGWP